MTFLKEIDSFSRLIRIPMYAVTLLFGTGKFIDSLNFIHHGHLYWSFIVLGDMFIIGVLAGEIIGIVKLWVRKTNGN